MKFTAKTKNEVESANLWDKGNYAFEILEASDEISKKTGKEMIKLKVKIFTDAGKSQNVFDYLLPDSMEYKLRHVAEACGLLADYEKGEMEAYQFIGKTGYAKVGVSIDKTGAYPDKNQINDYIVDDNFTSVPKTIEEATKNDEIPF
jgi:hypothetical protein